MAADAPGPAMRDRWETWGWAAIALAGVLAAAALQAPVYPNHDVAFLTWLANELAGPKTFGVDLVELNPPLAFMIYAPAAALGHLVGFGAAIKAWILLLFVVSVPLVWWAAERDIRTPVTLAIAVYFAFAFPREFGQREQIAFLLCAPYVAGPIKERWTSAASGLLAGIGFCLKPHFLCALVIVFLIRRRIRVEEMAIGAVGAVYALVLVAFFQPYLQVVVPLTAATYWGVSPTPGSFVRPEMLAGYLLVALPLALTRDAKGARAFIGAAIGFAVGGYLQGKNFPYHFLPAWGFLFVFLTARFASAAGIRRYAALFVLSASLVPVYVWSMAWLPDKRARSRDIPALVSVLDRYGSFTMIAVHPYPAFPTALYTSAKYVGYSNSHWFLPAVAKIETGQVKAPIAVPRLWAIKQATVELERKPAIVVVDTNWVRHTGLTSTAFDGLAWLRRDPRFGALWGSYEFAGRVGAFNVFRRKGAVPVSHQPSAATPAPTRPSVA